MQYLYFTNMKVTITCNAILIMHILPVVPLSTSDVCSLTLPPTPPTPLQLGDTNAVYIVLVDKTFSHVSWAHITVIASLLLHFTTEFLLYYFIMSIFQDTYTLILIF